MMCILLESYRQSCWKATLESEKGNERVFSHQFWKRAELLVVKDEFWTEEALTQEKHHAKAL